MGARKNLEDTLRSLFLSQGLAVLATTDGSAPYTSLMSVAVTGDLRHILFVTEQPSRKFGNIERNNEVALLFDNRSQSEDRNLVEGLAVTALGKAITVKDDERAWFADLFCEKHPGLQSFVESPTSVCMKVNVRSWVVVSRFQEVKELRMDECGQGAGPGQKDSPTGG